MDLRTTSYDDQPLPLLPIDIIDVSPLHSHVPPTRTLSRVSRVATATKANIVRLVPGRTTLPVAAPSRA